MNSDSPPPPKRENLTPATKPNAEFKRFAVLSGQWLLLLLLILPRPAAAQLRPSAQADGATQPALVPRELLWVLPRAPIGAHCAGSVVCTELGTWGIHARLT